MELTLPWVMFADENTPLNVTGRFYFFHCCLHRNSSHLIVYFGWWPYISEGQLLNALMLLFVWFTLLICLFWWISKTAWNKNRYHYSVLLWLFRLFFTAKQYAKKQSNLRDPKDSIGPIGPSRFSLIDRNWSSLTNTQRGTRCSFLSFF